jgi:hypothetical protein
MALDPIVAACTALHVCNCMPHVVLLSCTRLDCLRDSASGSQLYLDLLTPTQSPFCWYCTYSRSSQSEAVPRTVVCPPVGSFSCVSVGLSSPCRVGHGLAYCIMCLRAAVRRASRQSPSRVGPLTKLACMLQYARKASIRDSEDYRANIHISLRLLISRNETKAYNEKVMCNISRL